MSVGRPKIKRDAGVKAVFLLRKKTAFTPASLFIFGRRTDLMLLRPEFKFPAKFYSNISHQMML